MILTLRNRLDELPRVQQTFNQLVADHAIDEEAAYVVRLCVEELVSNVVRHAFDSSPHQIEVTLDVSPNAIDLIIEDDGRPFDPNSLDEIDTPLSLEDAPTGGMGLTMVKQMTGPIEYRRTDGHNRVHVRVPRQRVRL